MRTLRRLFALGLLLGLVAPATADEIVLDRDGDGWSVDGVALDLPAGARPDSLVAATDGTWLTAIEPGDGGETLRVVRVADGVVETLPSPAIETPGVIVRPTPVAADGNVEAMLWLEGTRLEATSLRWARWTGAGWSAPRTLSPVGPGTQTALRVAVLADGSWLATWSRFDGTDDEIMWSRFDGAAWSTPTALTVNAVPDVTPALRAHGEGALIAWGGFDGRDYRIHTARFDVDSGTWSTPHVLDGRGAIRPRFAALDTPLVVYRQAVPSRWTLVELSADARPLRVAASDRAEEPRAIEALDAGLRLDSGVVLAWGRGHQAPAER